jgi:hypothetical protein
MCSAALIAASASAWLKESGDVQPKSALLESPPISWSHDANGGIPSNAIRLGSDFDRNAVFGCEALVGPPGTETMQPGKLTRKLGGCSVTYRGAEYVSRDYQVLVSSADHDAFGLAHANGNALPLGSIQIGADTDGHALYFCVVRRFDGSDEVGKIQAGRRDCNYGYAGREQSYDSYKVLVMR